MLVLTRLRLAADNPATPTLDALRDAAAVFAERPGCLSVKLSRSTDDPELWSLVTSWDGAGAYRRALSSYDVKLRAVPVLYYAVDEPSAYEEHRTWTASTDWVEHDFDAKFGSRLD